MSTDFSRFYTPELVAATSRPAVVLAIWALSLVLGTLGYLGRCWFLYWLFYRRRPLLGYKIQPQAPSQAAIIRELGWSLSSCVCYAFLTTGLVLLALNGHTRLYLDITGRGWGYFFLSFPLMLLVHDAYFYFTHRLSHAVRLLFKFSHSVHHLSRNPTPFADIMFHPVDALLHAGFVPLFLFCLPLHPIAFGLFLAFVTGINALGHIGFEIFPDWRGPFGQFLTTWISRPTAHNLHHRRISGNYGLYFTFWDRICGTQLGSPSPKISGLSDSSNRSQASLRSEASRVSSKTSRIKT